MYTMKCISFLNLQSFFRTFLRKDEDLFNELLDMLTPLIQKTDTCMRKSVTPLKRLSVTLRYLASGNTFEDLKFLCAISPQTINHMVIETYEAIIVCLVKRIKVN